MLDESLYCEPFMICEAFRFVYGSEVAFAQLAGWLEHLMKTLLVHLLP